MTPTTTASQTALLSALLAQAKDAIDKGIAACPESKRLCQLGDNKATPLWLVGHMASVADFTGNSMGLGKELTFPKDWRSKFTPESFGGSPISADAGDYPSWDEVVSAFNTVQDNLIQGVAELSDDDLAGPPKGKVPERLQAALNSVQATLAMNLRHNIHHGGQLALLANSPD